MFVKRVGKRGLPTVDPGEKIFSRRKPPAFSSTYQTVKYTTFHPISLHTSENPRCFQLRSRPHNHKLVTVLKAKKRDRMDKTGEVVVNGLKESGKITSSESSDGNGGISMGNKDEGGNEDTGHEVKLTVHDSVSEGKVKKGTHMRVVTTFLAVIVQSTATVIGLHFVEQSSRASNLFTCVLITNLIGFVFLMALMWPNRHTNSPAAANALGRLGSSAAVLGFLFMMAINLPMWLILLACVALLAIMLLSSLDK